MGNAVPRHRLFVRTGLALAPFCALAAGLSRVPVKAEPPATFVIPANDGYGLGETIFHGDHGAQYTSRAYAALCDRLEVTRSMGAVGSSADNALAESFNATLKRETLAGATAWRSSAEARRAVFAWATPL